MVPESVNLFKRIGKAARMLYSKSEFWMPAGFFMLGDARLSIAQPTDLERSILDTTAACMNVRAEVRSSVNVEFKDVAGGGFSSIVPKFFFNSRDISTHAEFISLCSLDLDTHGNSFWYLDVAAQEFRRWDPQFVQVIIDKGQITGYRRSPEESETSKVRVFHLKRTTNLYHALIGRPLVDEVFSLISANRSMNQMFSRYLDTDGAPRKTVEFPKDSVLSPEQVEAMKIKFQQDYTASNASGAIGFLWGGGTLKTHAPFEFDYAKSYLLICDAIREGFRCPKIVFGNTDNVNFSNGLTSFLMFIELVINLFHQKLSDELTYFFQANKLYVQVTYTSRVDTSSLSGLTQNVDVFTKPANVERAYTE